MRKYQTASAEEAMERPNCCCCSSQSAPNNPRASATTDGDTLLRRADSQQHEHLLKLLFWQISLLAAVILFALLPGTADAFWVPPDYWATIYRNGQLEVGRSQHELLTFPPIQDSYIGYWINNSQQHHEAYGHVFVVPNRREEEGGGHLYCGNFADSWTNQSRYLCGGFRVLALKSAGTARPRQNPFEFVPSSIANPFLAVEYLDVQIARVQLQDGRLVYGGAKMAERVAFAADQQQRDRSAALLNFPYTTHVRDQQQRAADRVEILQRSAAFPPEDLLDDSRPRPLRPLFPPIASGEQQQIMPSPSVTTRAPPPPPLHPATTTTTTTIMPTTTTMGTFHQAEEEESITPDPILAAVPNVEMTTTPGPIDLAVDDYDDSLSGAGIEWGALFTGNGVEEVESRKEIMKKRELPPLNQRHRRRRRRHFKHRHPGQE